jgi:diacylglycerol kinase (ATP)
MHNRRGESEFYLLVNRSAAEFSQKKIDFLTGELRKAGLQYHLAETGSASEAIAILRRTIPRRPEGIIACGGDGSVVSAAQALIRRTTGLGIYPLGRFNNIYRSLYGEPDLKKAAEHILSNASKKIDHGIIGGKFFLGSIGLGFIPELVAQINNKKRIPRFGIGWSRMASQAAAMVEAKQLSITIDAFRFEMTPRILNINLLQFSAGLPISPASIDDDGKGEAIFDVGQNQAIVSSYIRQIFKKKYIYSDEIRMFRGKKISISPARDLKLYVDGDIIEYSGDSLEIEFFEKKIRVFYSPDPHQRR